MCCVETTRAVCAQISGNSPRGQQPRRHTNVLDATGVGGRDLVEAVLVEPGHKRKAPADDSARGFSRSLYWVVKSQPGSNSLGGGDLHGGELIVEAVERDRLGVGDAIAVEVGVNACPY